MKQAPVLNEKVPNGGLVSEAGSDWKIGTRDWPQIGSERPWSAPTSPDRQIRRANGWSAGLSSNQLRSRLPAGKQGGIGAQV